MALAIRSATRRNGRSGLEFIISQQIIKLLLESPLNIWDSTLAWVSLSRARCASLASISRIRKRKTNSSADGSVVRPSARSFFRRSSLAAREFARRDFSRAHLSHSPGSLPFFHSLVRDARTIPAIRGPRRLPDLTIRSLVYQWGPGSRHKSASYK